MFKCEIKTGNAAFCDPDTGDESEFWEAIELKRVLEDVCERLEAGHTSGSILDINGKDTNEIAMQINLGHALLKNGCEYRVTPVKC